MKIQESSKHPKTCVHCNNVILTTERRKVDGRMHRHLVCPKDDNSELTKLTNDWINK